MAKDKRYFFCEVLQQLYSESFTRPSLNPVTEMMRRQPPLRTLFPFKLLLAENRFGLNDRRDYIFSERSKERIDLICSRGCLLPHGSEKDLGKSFHLKFQLYWARCGTDCSRYQRAGQRPLALFLGRIAMARVPFHMIPMSLCNLHLCGRAHGGGVSMCCMCFCCSPHFYSTSTIVINIQMCI